MQMQTSTAELPSCGYCPPGESMVRKADPLGCYLLTVALRVIWDNLEAQWSPPPDGSSHRPSDTSPQMSGLGAGLCGGLMASEETLTLCPNPGSLERSTQQGPHWLPHAPWQAGC